MANYSGFDSFGSFMRGMNAGYAQQDRMRRLRQEDEERAYLKGERDYHVARRELLDGRADTQWDQQQEDRKENLAWQDYLRRAQKEDRAHALIRRPIEERQRDFAHELNMRGAEQGMRIRAAQEGRAARHDRLRIQMAEMGLDEAKLRRSQQEFAARIGSPARRFAITGDASGIASVWRELTGGDGDLVLGDDGVYYSNSPTTGKTRIGSREDILNALSMFSSSPEAYLSLRQELEMQKSRGATGGVRPTTLMQNAEYLRGMLPQSQGESDGDYNARLLDAANRARSRDPNAEFRSLVARIMERQSTSPDMNYKPDLDSAIAEARRLMSLTNSGHSGPPPTSSVPRVTAGAPKDGTKVRGRDGMIYVVRDGTLVPID